LQGKIPGGKRKGRSREKTKKKNQFVDQGCDDRTSTDRTRRGKKTRGEGQDSRKKKGGNAAR